MKSNKNVYCVCYVPKRFDSQFEIEQDAIKMENGKQMEAFTLKTSANYTCSMHSLAKVKISKNDAETKKQTERKENNIEKQSQ